MNFYNGRKIMFRKLIEKLFIKPDLITTDLNLDRNFNHWKVSQHTQKRMEERKIGYWLLKTAFKFGKETTKGLCLNFVDIPSDYLNTINLNNRKNCASILPLTVILNKADKVIKTVYSSKKDGNEHEHNRHKSNHKRK